MTVHRARWCLGTSWLFALSHFLAIRWTITCHHRNVRAVWQIIPELEGMLSMMTREARASVFKINWTISFIEANHMWVNPVMLHNVRWMRFLRSPWTRIRLLSTLWTRRDHTQRQSCKAEGTWCMLQWIISRDSLHSEGQITALSIRELDPDSHLTHGFSVCKECLCYFYEARVAWKLNNVDVHRLCHYGLLCHDERSAIVSIDSSLKDQKESMYG